MQKLGIILLAFYIANINGVSQIKPEFSWICENGKCVRKVHNKNGSNLNACKTTCGKFGTLWPQPTIRTELGKTVVNFDLRNVHVITRTSGKNKTLKKMLYAASTIFKSYLPKMHPTYRSYFSSEPFKGYGGHLIIRIDVSTNTDDISLDLETNERYKLSISKFEGKLDVVIVGETYFGVRHGLETLSQLITYNDENDCLQVIESAEIEDRPVYPHRGILVDTARNFISLNMIEKIIDAMSYNKLNTFHWHITDTHSFPFYSKRLPQMTEWGAYSKWKIYYPKNITDIIEYAKVRGVKVIPELDAPAHVAMGWQWAEEYGFEKFALCIGSEPNNCDGLLCGQLNPVYDEVYKTLEKLYKDFSDLFDMDLFHMGGDEVQIYCWNKTENILEFINSTYGGDRSKETFIKLWAMFQEKAFKKLNISYAERNVSAILWMSTLTSHEKVEEFLDRDNYIIQIWNIDQKRKIRELYNKKYRLILSNFDAWYFDCGYHSWKGSTTNNWCAPYKGWQTVYENSPSKRISSSEDDIKLRYHRILKRDPQILGGEACMWSETVDDGAIESKIWPRGAAVAERLWAEPGTSWRDAEYRMIHNRRRMLQRGINADALQPEWCHQNEGECFIAPPPPKDMIQPAQSLESSSTFSSASTITDISYKKIFNECFTALMVIFILIYGVYVIFNSCQA